MENAAGETPGPVGHAEPVRFKVRMSATWDIHHLKPPMHDRVIWLVIFISFFSSPQYLGWLIEQYFGMAYSRRMAYNREHGL